MELKTYIGILITKKEHIGTKSEGSEYYIQLEEPNDFGQLELAIRKEVHLWQEDPLLHMLVKESSSLENQSILNM